MNDKALAQKHQASASDPIDSSRLFPKVSKENCRENGCLDPGPAMVNCRRWLDNGRNQSCSQAACSGSSRNPFFRARKEIMKTENSGLAGQKHNERSAALPSPGGEGRMRAFSLSSFATR